MPVKHIPARAKDWDILGNFVQPAGANGTQHAAQAFVNAKGVVLSFGPTRTLTIGSSDGTTAGMDGVDRISDRTKVVNGVGAHSWWVFELVATGQQLCVDFNSATGAYIATMAWSPGGLFTGGSTTARPTATDEIVNRSAADWLIGNANTPLNITGWCSTDGANLTLFFSTTTRLVAGWMLGRVFDARSWITLPFYCSTFSNGAVDSTFSVATAFQFPTSANAPSARGLTNTNVKLWCTGQIAIGGAFIQSQVLTQNPLSGGWFVEQAGLWNQTAPDSGPWGRLPDHLFTRGPAHASAGVDPGNPNRIAICLGCWLMPWKNSAWALP